MWVALAIAATLLAVAVLAVILPVRLALRIDTDPWRFDLQLAPFAGLLGWVRVPRRAPRPQHPETRGKPAAMPRAPTLRALPGFLAAVLQCIRIDRLWLDLRFGTGDPGTTGQVYGWLMPLIHGTCLPPTARLRVSPDFDRACLSGRAEVELRVTPVRLAGPLFRLARAGRGWS